MKYVSLGEPCLRLIIRASFLISLECDMINTKNSSLDLPEDCIFMFHHGSLLLLFLFPMTKPHPLAHTPSFMLITEA